MLRNEVINKMYESLGQPHRTTKKINAWTLFDGFSIAVEVDSPQKGQFANVWLPFQPEFVTNGVEIYEEDRGRHSNTYKAEGLEKGKRVLKLKIVLSEEADQLLAVLKGIKPSEKPPALSFKVKDSKRSEQARTRTIQKSVKQFVWQRDEGRCTECGTRENLCFDHIIPFSKGGSNTERNIQLLCESCNLSKGAKI